MLFRDYPLRIAQAYPIALVFDDIKDIISADLGKVLFTEVLQLPCATTLLYCSVRGCREFAVVII